MLGIYATGFMDRCVFGQSWVEVQIDADWEDGEEVKTTKRELASFSKWLTYLAEP
jgi:hypothetical protein